MQSLLPKLHELYWIVPASNFLQHGAVAIAVLGVPQAIARLPSATQRLARRMAVFSRRVLLAAPGSCGCLPKNIHKTKPPQAADGPPLAAGVPQHR